MFFLNSAKDYAQYFLVVFQLNQRHFDYSTGKGRVRFAISHEMGQYCRNVVARLLGRRMQTLLPAESGMSQKNLARRRASQNFQKPRCRNFITGNRPNRRATREGMILVYTVNIICYNATSNCNFVTAS